MKTTIALLSVALLSLALDFTGQLSYGQTQPEASLTPPDASRTTAPASDDSPAIPIVDQLPDTGAATSTVQRPFTTELEPNPALIKQNDLGVVFSANAGGGLRGLTVVEVLPRSLAAYLGIRAGDNLLSLDGTPLNSTAVIPTQLKKTGTLLLRLRRGSRYHSVTIREDDRAPIVASRGTPRVRQ